MSMFFAILCIHHCFYYTFSIKPLNNLRGHPSGDSGSPAQKLSQQHLIGLSFKFQNVCIPRHFSANMKIIKIITMLHVYIII